MMTQSRRDKRKARKSNSASSNSAPPAEDIEPSNHLPAKLTDDPFYDSFYDSFPMLRYDRIPAGVAEGLRGIINRYELREGDPLPKSIAVTSALSGEGVTTVSQSMATLIAQEMGRFVCWVDCSWLVLDATTTVSDGRQSIVDLLTDPSRILSAFQTSPELPQLMAISAGPVPAEKRNMIVRSREFERLLEILAVEFDHVIFDVPPVLANSNALALLRAADASLMVVDHRSTSISQVRRAIASTQPTINLGVVLNRYRSSIPARVRHLLGE